MKENIETQSGFRQGMRSDLANLGREEGVSARDAILRKKERLITSLFSHIEEEAQQGLSNYGSFTPGEVFTPTYRYLFETDSNTAIFEIEQFSYGTEEVRRYIFREGSVKKGGYIEGPQGVTHYTDDQQEYIDRGLEDGEFLADLLDVDFFELDTLSKLILDPQSNARFLDSLPRLPF